jgi:hypothetical protein
MFLNQNLGSLPKDRLISGLVLPFPMITSDEVYMNEIVKICKKHGELTLKQTTQEKGVNKIYYRCRFCRTLSSRKWEKRNPGKVKNIRHSVYLNNVKENRKKAIIRNFKISKEEFDILHEKQGNLCAICKNPETVKNKSTNDIRALAIDHSHVTGKIRGLLCHTCNRGIGLFRDSCEILNNAINYLKENN